MAVYGYTKNYKLIKPQFDTDTWHDYEYDNLDTIDAVLSAIFASGDWQGFWKTNTHYDAGGVVIDRDTDTMYKIMVEHTTSEATFAEEFAANPTYYELWSPNNLAEDWAIKMDGEVSYTDYSSKAYAISSALIDNGSAREWAIKTGGSIGTTGEYSAKKYATDAHNDYISMTTDVNVIAVGTNIANVNTVGQSISDVNTVASDISSVNTVAGISTDVTTVASIATAVSNVSSIESEVLDVSDNRTDISTVASNIGDVNTVADISTDVSTVADNNTNVTTVATNISDVNTAATNIAAIQAAPTQAANAAASATLAQEWASKMDGQVASTDYSSKYYAGQSTTSADNSHVWAEGTDEQVQALGGVHSSKVWAEQSTNANIALTNSPYTTNRILEIPQDIKLELNNGTLMLKAGSKVYVPNGFEQDGTTPKFDVVTTAENKSLSGVQNLRSLVFHNPNYFPDWPRVHPSSCFSGTTAPSGYAVMAWYDTSNNIMKITTDGGSTWMSGFSLPYVEITETTTGVSIDQVFNGFGYIGSTLFVFPMKGEATTAINQDGTVTKIIWESTTIQTATVSASGVYSMSSSGVLTAGFNEVGYTKLADVTYYNSRIQSVNFYDIGFVANSNASNFSQAGRSYLSGLGKPKRSIMLTTGASGSTYTAPANGWFRVTANPNSGTNGRLHASTLAPCFINTGSGSIDVEIYVPVSKGEVVTYTYSGGFYNTNNIQFIYDAGEN